MTPVTATPTNRPTANPQHNETREIIRLTQSRKKVYPDLTLDNFDDYNYEKLVQPLRQNPNEISKIQKDFLKNMDNVEKVLETVALRNFSYVEAKNSATGRADKALFAQLERQMGIVSAAQSTPVGKPNLEKLFAAQTSQEFENRLKDPNIVQRVYKENRTFVARARRVFDYIKRYRKQSQQKLQKEQITRYLNDIFSGDKDKIDESTIIKPSLLSPKQRAEVEKAHDQYVLFRKRLEKQLRLEKVVRKERETFLSKPIEYAKSGERYVAEKIQNMRDHWAGMDGKEKTIAGITILLGTAWFLNSQKEGVQKARNAMMKAGLIALGYVGINTTSKVLFGKSLQRMTGSYIEDRSGKRDFLKESFNTDKKGADNLQTSLAVLGNHDFLELSDAYLREEARYQKFHTPDNLRGIPVGGVAEHEMSPHTIYKVMKLVDRKLRKNNSSIALLHDELAKAKASAQRAGKPFVAPTWAMIMTAILQNQKLNYHIDKKGNISVKAEKIQTTWETNDKQKTRTWWPLTGRPKDWRLHLIDNKPKEKVNSSQLDTLSSSIIPENKPLSGIIHASNFGRYTRGFNALYVQSYSKHKERSVHTFEDTGEKAMYVTSKTKVEAGSHSKTIARITSVRSAHQQAMESLKKTIKNTQNHPLKSYLNRLNEFVQPVFGTFIGPSKKNAKEYVMFLRVVLPGSSEFTLRKDREWPEGNMMEQMKKKPLKTGDKLTRADFDAHAKRQIPTTYPNDIPQIKAFKTAFGGAYESFLAKIKLNKNQTDEIDKVLTYYSKRFAGSGITKSGLIRYLATHQFTEQEIREARGLSSTDALPNEKLEIYKTIRGITLSAKIKNESNEKRAYILNSLGHIVVLACNGDSQALKAIKSIDADLHTYITNFRGVPKMQAPSLWPPIMARYQTVLAEAYNSTSAAATAKQKAIQKTADAYFSA
ncbi:hypothetical protein GF369_00320 [Candidatus Peregrinibacteria bacterium]|nr:hypothetical protein [Candidatus Peregrinibacteria bacterium]